MTITNKNVMKIETEQEERVCMDATDSVLMGVTSHLDITCGDYYGVRLYDPATGEIIDGEEIARARAIINFIMRNPVVEIQM